MLVADFHSPLGIETERERESITVTPWREAVRDPMHRRAAGQEVAQKATILAAGAASLTALAIAVNKAGENPETGDV